MQAIGFIISPEEPIFNILILFSFISSFNISVLSMVSFPQICSASLNSTVSSLIYKYTGFSLFPSITRASYVDFLNNGAQCPPPAESRKVLVNGDLVVTLHLALPGAFTA